MRVVTVGALDRPFVDAMLVGQVKACADFEVAGVADILLGSRQEWADLRRAMNRVAGDAADFAGRVSRSANRYLAKIIGVASETAI